jgi:hypothetical protein
MQSPALYFQCREKPLGIEQKIMGVKQMRASLTGEETPNNLPYHGWIIALFDFLFVLYHE